MILLVRWGPAGGFKGRFPDVDEGSACVLVAVFVVDIRPLRL
jgi:hypothetical protein